MNRRNLLKYLGLAPVAAVVPAAAVAAVPETKTRYVVKPFHHEDHLRLLRIEALRKMIDENQREHNAMCGTPWLNEISHDLMRHRWLCEFEIARLERNQPDIVGQDWIFERPVLVAKLRAIRLDVWRAVGSTV